MTSRDQMRDEIAAFETGADDYLTKPCRGERILTRIENLLRRYEGRRRLYVEKNVWLDPATGILYCAGTPVSLTGRESQLLELLLRKQGQIVTNDEIRRKLWGTSQYLDENILQVNVARLRRRLKEAGIRRQVEAVRRTGYRISGPDRG